MSVLLDFVLISSLLFQMCHIYILMSTEMAQFVSDEDLAEARRWYGRQTVPPNNRASRQANPAVHLLLGDSIACDAQLESRFRDDKVLSCARRGATMESVLYNLAHDISRWEVAAAAWGLARGDVIIWVSSNDVYSRWTGLGSIQEDLLEDTTLLLRRIMGRVASCATGVVILGPLARPDGELRGIAWEKTAAFHLERRTMKMAMKLAETMNVKYVTLGRCLTKKAIGRHAITEDVFTEWYRPDGIHLNGEGYSKIADAMHLPVWIRFGAAV